MAQVALEGVPDTDRKTPAQQELLRDGQAYQQFIRDAGLSRRAVEFYLERLAGTPKSGQLLRRLIDLHLPAKDGLPLLRAERHGHMWWYQRHADWRLHDHLAVSERSARRFLKRFREQGLVETRAYLHRDGRMTYIRVLFAGLIARLQEMLGDGKPAVNGRSQTDTLAVSTNETSSSKPCESQTPSSTDSHRRDIRETENGGLDDSIGPEEAGRFAGLSEETARLYDAWTAGQEWPEADRTSFSQRVAELVRENSEDVVNEALRAAYDQGAYAFVWVRNRVKNPSRFAGCRSRSAPDTPAAWGYDLGDGLLRSAGDFIATADELKRNDESKLKRTNPIDLRNGYVIYPDGRIETMDHVRCTLGTRRHAESTYGGGGCQGVPAGERDNPTRAAPNDEPQDDPRAMLKLLSDQWKMLRGAQGKPQSLDMHDRLSAAQSRVEAGLVRLDPSELKKLKEEEQRRWERLLEKHRASKQAGCP